MAVEILVLPHLVGEVHKNVNDHKQRPRQLVAALDRACGGWYGRRCFKEALVIDRRLLRSGEEKGIRRTMWILRGGSSCLWHAFALKVQIDR